MKMNLCKGTFYVLLVLAMNALPVKVFGGEPVKESRDLDNFTKIKLTISANLVISQGSEQKVILEGDKDDLEKIVTEVKDGSLKIEDEAFTMGIKKVTIYITIPEIEAIAVSGSGNLKNDGPIKIDEFSIAVSGSGDIHFDQLKTKEVNTAISGSGDILLEGKNDGKLQIAISGSGDINCEDFKTNLANIVVSGSGDCFVNVSEALNVKISGSGDVLYQGSPKVNVKISGSGKVKSAS